MDEKHAVSSQVASVEQRVAAIEAVFEARGMEPAPFIEKMTHAAEGMGPAQWCPCRRQGMDRPQFPPTLAGEWKAGGC